MDNNIRFFKYLIQFSGSMKDWISVKEIVRIICEALLIPWRKSLSYIRAAFCEENLTPEAYKCGSFLELTKTLSAKDFTTLSYRLPWNLMIIVSNLEDLYYHTVLYLKDSTRKQFYYSNSHYKFTKEIFILGQWCFKTIWVLVELLLLYSMTL